MITVSEDRKFRFNAKQARTLPDPIDKDKNHYFYWVKAADMPEGLPKEPNPRALNTNRWVYRDVENSFLNNVEEGFTPYTFHLKNKGMDLVAQYVNKVGEDLYEVGFGPGDGILNGNHTYEIILENRDEVPDQYVLLKIVTNIDQEFIPEMAGGLNTSVQVRDDSLLNQEGAFNWIKDLISDESYADKIAYKENLNLALDIREVIQILTLFNIRLFNIDNDPSNHPKLAYNQKKKCLDLYKEETETYVKLKPVVKDIFRFHDIVKKEGYEFHKEDGGTAQIGYINTRAQVPIELPFIAEETKKYLSKGALYPILASFRLFLEDNGSFYEWRTDDGFVDVLRMWRSYGIGIMREIKNVYNEVKTPDKLGKSSLTWSTIQNKLVTSFIQEKGNIFS